MAGRVTIRNLRNIDELHFDLPQPGVWLLTAGNGAGKTSLLACLQRIGNANAFPLHFPSSAKSEKLDDFVGANISYQINGETVVYTYGGARWAPQPRRLSNLLDSFGYPAVIYLGANADRLTPRPEDFVPRQTRPASTVLIQVANEIFETRKFDNLKIVNLTRGNRNQAFLLKISDDPVKYHSEKQFSLGELCILKLIERIRVCPNQSLILIDELEMALHPRAQINLYRYLRSVASQKQLTVIFSTHSVSLLKSVPRRNIIFIDRDSDGRPSVVYGCFPTFAIGNISFGEERAPDVIFYVEDEAAKAILEVLVRLACQIKYNQDNLWPEVRVVPIGTFDSVVRFLTYQGALLPDGTNYFAFLDNDVKTETIAIWQRTREYEQLAQFEKLKAKIAYLPWTPEVGLLFFLRDNRQHVERELRAKLRNRFIHLRQDQLVEADALDGAGLRRRAKRILRDLCAEIGNGTGLEVDDVFNAICEEFAKEQFTNNHEQICDLLFPRLVDR